MMYPVLLHGDGREKKINRGFQFGQLLQEHPNPARNWLNAVAKNLVDLHADVVRPRCTELCMCLLRDMLQELKIYCWTFRLRLDITLLKKYSGSLLLRNYVSWQFLNF